MTTFDDRQKAFEEKFAHDEELRFKANVKAAKLFGEWAANQLGVSKDAYVTELVNMVTAGKNEEALLSKVGNDAVNKGKQLSKAMLVEKFSALQNQAREYVTNH